MESVPFLKSVSNRFCFVLYSTFFLLFFFAPHRLWRLLAVALAELVPREVPASISLRGVSPFQLRYRICRCLLVLEYDRLLYGKSCNQWVWYLDDWYICKWCIRLSLSYQDRTRNIYQTDILYHQQYQVNHRSHRAVSIPQLRASTAETRW